METTPPGALCSFPDDCLPPEQDYDSRDALFKSINSWAVSRGYAFTTGRSTKEKSGRLTITYACDRSCRPPDTSRERQRRTSTRGTECQFSVLAKESLDKSTWSIRHRPDKRFSSHNHPPSENPSAHPGRRRIATEVESSRPLWIGGADVPGTGPMLTVKCPATGNVIDYVQSANTSDVDTTINLAHATYKSGIWSRASRQERAQVLDSAAVKLSANLDALIALEVAQTGRPVREMNAQVPSLIKWFQYYAALLRTEERPVMPTVGALHNWVDRVPLGVVVLITPFNHPLLIAVKKLAPALAAGNSVILKPSELTPITSLALGHILAEAGLPNGVFSVLPGYGTRTGRALVQNPLVRKVDVTGSTAAGRAIGSLAGRGLATFTAELGGKAPVVVLEKANIDAAVNGVVFGSFIASGQTCVAATRIIVQESILEEFTQKLLAKVGSIEKRMGSPQNPQTMMGPVISKTQLDAICKLVDDSVASGFATVLCGGSRMMGISELDGTDFSKGYFFAPTVLASTTPQTQSIVEAPLWREEAFGPVIVLVGFSTEEEAVALANDSDYGLGAAVWTQDVSQAFRITEQIEAGIVWVNSHHRNDPSSPWGGVKPGSGVGSENGKEAYYSYTKMKSTIINYAPVDEALVSEDWFREDAAAVRYG
ncbi:uncharacterized protein BROUX77_003326 [Berkeleyomyces rouxiae]|uniref:uncharacterized protein n=1 Tax=Berkeleyomyces rouxiae TaxID=2035830 RepID=UPI003B80EDE2